MAVDFLLEGLKSQLSSTDVAHVLATVRQDALVWAALDEENFCGKALAACSNQVVNWNPAMLSLVAIGEEAIGPRLAIKPMQPLEAALRQLAVRTYEDFRRKGVEPVDLREAGLVGLALRERRRLTGSWNGMVEELLTSPSGVRSVEPRVWKTILACLAGFIPDSQELMEALLISATENAGLEWNLHIALTQPAEEDEQAKRLALLLREQPVEIQLDFIKSLQTHGCNSLAEKTANGLLVGHTTFANLNSKQNGNSVIGLAGRAVAFQQLAAMHHLAGNPAQAEAALKSAQVTLQNWEAGLSLQSAEIRPGSKGPAELKSACAEFAPSEKIAKVGLRQSGMVVASQINADGERVELDELGGDPIQAIEKAEWLFKRDDKSQAVEIARQAVEEYIDAIRSPALYYGGDFVYRWEPRRVVEILGVMGMPKEAALAGEAVLLQRPADVEIIELTSKMQQNGKSLERAKELALVAVNLAPGETPYHRHLAGVYEELADWGHAFESRRKCLDLETLTNRGDQEAYARSALQAGYPDETSAVCESILAEEPDNGNAHGLLGLARAKQGRTEEAILHLNRATLVTSENAKWWLALAGLYEDMDDARTALDTLRAGVLSASDSGDIHFRLAEKLLAEGMNAEALPHLKLAAGLMPENEEIAFRLSKTLRTLGYLPEAKHVIDGLRPKWSGRPEIAFEYGRIALALGDQDAAIPAMEQAVRSDRVEVGWLNDYSELLLNEAIQSKKLDQATRYQMAETYLRKSLELEPGNVRITLRLAEALRKEGKLSNAYAIYQDLVEMPEIVEQNLLWSVQHGYGLTALGLHQIEPGITLLKEAAQRKQDSLALQQDLAGACLSANLVQDAAEAAERALEIAPDDNINLAWFAGLMVKLGKVDRAAEALRCAIELSPHRSDLLVRYATLELESGHIQDAQDALSKLPEMDGYDPDVLQQAAYLYLRMQEPEAAVENLEKAVMLSDQPSLALLYDLATVYSDTGKIDQAIQTIQNVVDGCKDIRMHVFHADLLARQNRTQAALISLDKALKLAQATNDCGCDQLAGIHQRSAKWLRELGNVASANEQIEKAIEYAPDDYALRFQAIDLAGAILQDEKASKYALLPFEAVHCKDMDADGLHLACLSGHLALQDGRIEDAQGLLAACRKIDTDDMWVKTLQARLSAVNGEFFSAQDLIQQVVAEIDQHEMQPGDNTLWAARAAFDACLWDDSIRLFDTYINKFPAELRASFELGKVLVEAGEMQRLCDELGIQAHAPGLDLRDDSTLVRFEESFGSVKGLINPDEAVRWQARAGLVFNPTLNNLQELAATTRDAMDAAAMMAGLRVMKDIPAALLAGQGYEEESGVKLQKALCLVDSDPAAGLAAAESAAGKSPSNPIYLAGYAKLAETTGRYEAALSAVETALSIWPDEAQWHAWAGGLALKLDDMKASIAHWKEAFALQPECAQYAIELGQAFYADGDYILAEEMLGKAVESDPENASAWLSLAYAQRALDKIDKAASNALKSSELDATSVDGLVLASQISQEIGARENALDQARAALHRNPSDPRAIVNLSRILIKQGLPNESLQVIEQSLNEQVENRELLIEQAKLIYQMQGPAASVKLVDKLIETYPEDAEALALHATIQAEIGDLKIAERSAFRSLRIRPDQPGLALTLGKLTRKAGQLDQAVHLLSQAISMHPDYIEAYLELGQAYIDRREHNQALVAFGHAMRVAPRDPRGYYQAALILKETKDYPGAENMLQNAAKYAPDDLQIHRQLVGVMALNLIHKSQEANTAL
jgi:tetratricopeptide (TPR) repeat protein